MSFWKRLFGRSKIQEGLTFAFKLGWVLAYENVAPEQGYIREFVEEGDDIENWKRLLTLQNFAVAASAQLSPENSFRATVANREQEYPGLTEWNVIAVDAKSILYEWQAKPCGQWPEQHEIVRILNGEHNVFRLAYTVKQYQMPSDERSEWIGRLSESWIERRAAT